ncbi:MAG TPA: RluA family pseudouridine synthase [Bacteroidales bacterium]|jgi:23S rRNA pseudouridine1911/1915/1917 synthase|nr:RluA family pseudouridine synthase [Bacteroidales bacterium]
MKNKNDIILTVDIETTLMPFLLSNLKDKSRDNIKSLLRNRQVLINGKAVSQFNHPLHTGENVTISKLRKSDMPPDKYLQIVYEDEYIIIIDKKAGLLSVSDGHEHETAFDILSEWIKKKDASSRIYIVHRLDQYTSGLLMFVKNENIQNILRNEWKQFITERTYTAIVEGNVTKEKGTIRSFLAENKSLMMVSVKDSSKGKLAITHYKKIKHNELYSLLEVSLETGKKNQIRVHMYDISHPVAGDRKYGARTNPVGRLCLHATILALKHPVTGQVIRLESPVPKEFLKLVNS